MLKLITGDAGSGKTTHLTSLISADLAAGTPVILLVPEQQTVTRECLMADILPPSATLLFEVTNFTRLCDTVFRRVGGLAGKSATPASMEVLMWRTLSELQPFLHTALQPDIKTVTTMCAVVRDLRAMNLRPLMLEAAAARLSDDALSDKLRDYALISSTFHALLCEYFSDSADHLDRLAELLLRDRPFTGTKIYLDNFSGFTEQEYAILNALIISCDMTLTLCIPPKPELQLCAAEVLQTQHRLLRLAAEAGVTVTQEATDGNHRQTDPALSYAIQHLFRADYASLPTGPAGEGALTLVEASDPAEACDYIAADILRRVQGEGARFGDFTVVCSSAAQYDGILDSAFNRNNIPYFFSRKNNVLSLEAVKMIFCAYAVAGNGWQREDVISYLKCSLTGLDRNVCDEVELYAETWNIRGSRWHDGKAWDMNPDGYSNPHSDGRREYLAGVLSRVNSARNAFVPPLATLTERIKGRQSVTTHVVALTEFLLSLSLPKRLDARAAALHAAGDHATAQAYEKLWDILCDALDTLTSLIPDTPLNAQEFSDLLRLICNAADMGRIPATIDEVTIGEARLLHAEEVRHIYLVGVNEGEFPAPVADTGAFTEGEREALDSLGICGGDSLDNRAARELFSFYRAATLSTGSVTILWTRMKANFEAASPADAILRLRKLLPPDYPVRHIGGGSDIDLLYSKGTATERLGRYGDTPVGHILRDLLTADPALARVATAVGEPIRNADSALCPDTASVLYPGDLSLTYSRIEQFAKCPLSHFCKYVLKLDDGAKAEFNSIHVGNFIHRILECFFRVAQQRGLDIRHLTEEERSALLSEIDGQVIGDILPASEADVPRTRHLLSLLRRTSGAVVRQVCEEFAHSLFLPAFYELPITRGDASSPEPVSFDTPDGKKIYIFGTIDRVDTYKKDGNVYVRVVDYKTGGKDFSLSDISRGINLQMLLYLFTLQNAASPQFRSLLGVSPDGQILPGGVLYFSALTKETTVNAPPTKEQAFAAAQGAMQHAGVLLNDPALLDAMDDTPDKHYLDLNVKKGVCLSGKSMSLATLEEMGQLMDTVATVLGSLAEGMKRGDASATPLHDKRKRDVCEYCAYKPVCRNTGTRKT